MNYPECRKGPRRVENMKGDKNMEGKIRRSKCISTQNSRKKELKEQKRGNI